jgi:hypothetical protein
MSWIFDRIRLQNRLSIRKKNDKANSFIKRFKDQSNENDESNDQNKHMHQTVLSAKKMNSKIVQQLNDTKKNSNAKLFLFDKIKLINQKNSTCITIRDATENRKTFFNEMLLKRFEIIENILFFKKKLWVLESNQLKLNIIREIHDQFASEHSNIRRTHKYLSKWYYWSQVKKSVERYVRNCHICEKFKATRNKYSELLNFLFILNHLWTNIIMNFVIELSENKDFNAILMMINRLTKMHHYISCKAEEDDTNVEKTTRLLINHVWKLHELSSTIMSNWESQFISFVRKIVCKTLKINVKLSTAFHSKIDNQSEIAN